MCRLVGAMREHMNHRFWPKSRNFDVVSVQLDVIGDQKETALLVDFELSTRL
jgi:hypothetical protein